MPNPVPFHRARTLEGPARRTELECLALALMHARVRSQAVREYLLLVARLSRKA